MADKFLITGKNCGTRQTPARAFGFSFLVEPLARNQAACGLYIFYTCI